MLAQILNRRPKQEPIRLHEQRLQRVVLDPGVLCGVHGFHCLGDATENRVYGTASPAGPAFSCERLSLVSG